MSHVVARAVRCLALLLVLSSFACKSKSSGGTAGGSGGAGGASGTNAGGEDAGGDGGCKAPNVVLFTKPGCGSDVMPSCVTGHAGACATVACGCDGRTVYGPCNGLPTRFTASGACLGSAHDAGL